MCKKSGFELLESLCNIFGPSGCEDPVAKAILENIEGCYDELIPNRCCGVIAHIKGNGKSEKKLMLSAVSVGDVVFAGFPGEPFTEVGREIKSRSKFEFTIPSCCTNGYEGYYPMAQVYEEGGYECNSARDVKGTAEKLIEESCALINSL